VNTVSYVDQLRMTTTMTTTINACAKLEWKAFWSF